MRVTILFTLVLAFSVVNCKYTAQQILRVEIETLSIPEAPGIQSYSHGKTSDGKWLILGGRTDGMHKRRPFESFSRKENNTQAFILDPIKKSTAKVDLSTLPATIFEQLQSTNQEFHQRDNILYIIGGYGYSETERDHITYPYLTAIDVDGLATAIIEQKGIIPFFRQIKVSELAVTGGQLGLLQDTFYLCGGQFFEGRYNPMGPNHGPGFTQQYTNAIQTFKIKDDGKSLEITDYKIQEDRENLHRRDYNMVPQIFPDGSSGFTMFSGVFQHQANIPWLNSVDVTPAGYTVNNDFNQYLSQYHSAKIPIYNSASGEMMTIFFGGLSQFEFDENGTLVEDKQVPFVRTISQVTRHADGSMTEKDLGIKMPAFLGSGAEFIPVSNEAIFLDHEILDLKKLPSGKTLVGYIYGGIESSRKNVFFTNNAHQSIASNQIFEVYVIIK